MNRVSPGIDGRVGAQRIGVSLLLALLAACSSTPPSDGRLSRDQSKVVSQAHDLIGTPYRYGGSSPRTGFDCSGLIHYVYQRAADINLPRSTAELTDLRTKRPSADALQPGDLLLFRVSRGSRVDHAGIYIGNRSFIHAPSSGGRVRIESLDARYWRRSYQGARRVLD